MEDGSSAGRQRAGAGPPERTRTTVLTRPTHLWPQPIQRVFKLDEADTTDKKPCFTSQRWIQNPPPTSQDMLSHHIGERPLKDTSVDEALLQEVEVEVLKTSHLPLGWTTDETGHMVLGPIQDEWKLEGSHLVRYHYMPRNSRFTPEVDDCPIPLDHLSKHQESYDGNNRRFDKWKNKETQRQVFGLATPASRSSPAIEDRPLSSSMLLVKDRPVMSQRRRKMTEASMNVI